MFFVGSTKVPLALASKAIVFSKDDVLKSFFFFGISNSISLERGEGRNPSI